MNRSNTSANKDIGHIVKDMLRLLVAYGVAVLFMGRAWSLRTLGGYDRAGSDIRAALCIGKGRAISV